MNIAIFGATSYIAKDLIHSFARFTSDALDLFSRRPHDLSLWLQDIKAPDTFKSLTYSQFSNASRYDLVINFIGVGDPGKASALGQAIFHVTDEYDQLILRYLQDNPQSQYVFISSGAVYGHSFLEPVQKNSDAQIAINTQEDKNWYAKAKLFAELRHRANSHLSIIDLRIFNYFSSSIDLQAKYLICDIVRSILSKHPLTSSSDNIWRDYLSKEDFFQLIRCIINAGLCNTALDCYSQAPIDKITLLETMKNRFGLCYNLTNAMASNCKKHYYSLNQTAAEIGFTPSKTSMDCLIESTNAIVGLRSQTAPCHNLD